MRFSFAPRRVAFRVGYHVTPPPPRPGLRIRLVCWTRGHDIGSSPTDGAVFAYDAAGRLLGIVCNRCGRLLGR